MYDPIKKAEGDKVKGDIFLIQVLAKDNEKIWWYTLKESAINEDPDYIASFQMELVDTRK